MALEDPAQVTHSLDAAAGGNEGAADQLWQAVNDEIRQMAAGFLARERQSPTLQPTLVVLPNATALDRALFEDGSSTWPLPRLSQWSP